MDTSQVVSGRWPLVACTNWKKSPWSEAEVGAGEGTHPDDDDSDHTGLKSQEDPGPLTGSDHLCFP